MEKITLQAEAGQVSAELARHGIAPDVRVQVLIEIMDSEANVLSIATMAQAGGAFDWLAREPDLYTDADLVQLQVG